MSNIILNVENLENKERLDSYLGSSLLDYSRSKIKSMIDDGKILLNGKQSKGSKQVGNGDTIEVMQEEPVVADILPEDIEFGIVYEDDSFAIIDKPQGLIVHPTSAMRSGTLVNGLMKRLDNLSGINGVLRPGIVHRIDKDTSGLLVVAKNDVAHNSLAKQIAEKSCKRSYVSINEGIFEKDSGTIQTNIGRNPRNRKSMAVVKVGKVAITDYTVMERFESGIKATMVRFDLHTGRTHQIRVHSKHIGHPVMGDPLYGYLRQKFKHLSGQLLHAERLELTHPVTGERMTFNSPLPSYFEEVIEELRNPKE